jgi:hypothetical protein
MRERGIAIFYPIILPKVDANELLASATAFVDDVGSMFDSTDYIVVNEMKPRGD